MFSLFNKHDPETEASSHGTKIPHVFDDTTDANIVAIPTATDDSADTDATEQVIEAVANDRQCTLTIGEAQSLFTKRLRRPLSPRSLQRYCQKGAILAQMISHSQGKEWLINEPSLMKFIDRYPITLTDEQAPLSPLDEEEEAPTTPTAHPPVPDTAATLATDDDKPIVSHRLATPPPPKPATEPQIGDATAATDDKDDYVAPSQSGETRRVGEVLIENARLNALLAGKDEVIATLKHHDDHMRDQLNRSQSLIGKLTGDVAHIASQMLHTMAQIGTGGRALPNSNQAERPSDELDGR